MEALLAAAHDELEEKDQAILELYEIIQKLKKRISQKRNENSSDSNSLAQKNSNSKN